MIGVCKCKELRRGGFCRFESRNKSRNELRNEEESVKHSVKAAVKELVKESVVNWSRNGLDYLKNVR